MVSLQSLMSLEDSIGNECSGDAPAAEVTTIQTLNSFLCRFNGFELDVDFTLQTKTEGELMEVEQSLRHTWVSFSTLMPATGPYLSSHSARTSSASSLSQSRSVSLWSNYCSAKNMGSSTSEHLLFWIKHVIEKNRLGLHCLRNVRFHSAAHLWV